MRALTTDMAKQELRPYFLWDEDVSIAELHQILAGPDGPRRDQLLAKMLREARDIDVWHFVRPVEVARVLERLRRSDRPPSRLLGVPDRGLAHPWPPPRLAS